MPIAAGQIDPRNPHYGPRRPGPLGGDASRMPCALPEARAIELPCTGVERAKAKGSIGCVSGTSRNFIECPLVDGGAGSRAYFAAAGGNSDELGTILVHERGAAEWHDEEGRRPLHAACRHGHSTCVSLLVNAGAHLDCQADTGWTPLICAAYWGHADCVRLLLGAGADWRPYGRGRHGMRRTARGWALSTRNDRCAALLHAAERAATLRAGALYATPAEAAPSSFPTRAVATTFAESQHSTVQL